MPKQISAKAKAALIKKRKQQVGIPKELSEERKKEILLFLELVEKVRKSRNKKKSDLAFDRIVSLLERRINQISYKFKIPGFSFTDVVQEALFALRYKAIKDYDKGRSLLREISPFDKFAILCINRHLATKLKASFQNKSLTLNIATSLDENRNSESGADEPLCLVDILPEDKTTILDKVQDRELYKLLVSKLYQKLSLFEKEVFILYKQKYSYEEIAILINKRRRVKRGKQIKVKSVDNALSRIKSKGQEIVKKYDKEEV